MAAWRRRALELFPDLKAELQNPDFTIHQLYFELLPQVKAAHRAQDDVVLRRVYGFADWCRAQRTENLWNAAGVAFYEHLFDTWSDRERVLPWLSPAVIADSWSLWEARLTSEELAELQRSLERRTVHRWREYAV